MPFDQPYKGVNQFIAAFYSDCFTCGGEIQQGQIAGYLPEDGYPSCEDCIDEHNEGRDCID